MYIIHLDINECAFEDTNDCHGLAKCINTKGSYNCTCLVGYEGNGLNCTGEILCMGQKYLSFVRSC